MTFLKSVTSAKQIVRGGALALAMILVPVFLMAGPENGHTQKAKIITSNEKPVECISSVHVNAIDGQQVYVQPLGFDLEPGNHSMTARTIVNTSFCKAVGPSNGKEKTEPLVADFEAGKTYYLGYDHSSTNRKDWKLVIWKVEG